MSAPPSAIVAIDAGTSALRVLAFDARGRRLASFSRPTELRRGHDGGAEQSPQDWTEAMRSGLRKVAAALAASHEVEAIALTSQRATVLAVDADGAPVFPAISWRDRRGAAEADRLAEELGEELIYARTGLRANSYFTAPKLMWFARAHPEADGRARHYLSVQDYLALELTGETGTEWTQASRTMLFDGVRNSWDPDLIAASGLDPARLPEPAAPGSVLSGLRAELAGEAGLPTGVPVVLGGGDQQCGALGLGVLEQGEAAITVSSGSFVLAPVGEPRRDAERRVLCSPAAVPGRLVLEAGVQTAMSNVAWLLATLGLGSGETEVDAALESSPPGAGGVLLLPHFNGLAAPRWDPRARGAILGLTEAHGRADLVRAALEGIALDVRRNLEVLAEVREPEGSFAELRVGGGVSRSERFNQLQADVYEAAVLPVGEPESAALGAAIGAAVAVGLHADHGEAVARMVEVDGERRANPRADLAPLYDELAQAHERALVEISPISPLGAEDEEGVG